MTKEHPIDCEKNDQPSKHNQDSKQVETNENDIVEDDVALEPTNIEEQPEALTAVEDLGYQILNLVHTVAFGERAVAQKAKRFPFAFEIDEEILQKINRQVEIQFSKLQTWPPNTLQFSAEVGLADLSTESFNEFGKMLDEAGDRDDPERLILVYRTLLENPLGTQAYVKIDFITEKPLETEELGFFEYHQANMELSIGGPTKSWVDEMYSTLYPIFETAKLGGIYKPLLIFRNKNIVHLTSWSIAIMGQVFGIEYFSRLLRGPDRQDHLTHILNQVSLEEKFDEYMRSIYSENSPLLQPVLILGGALIIFGVTLYLGFFLLPKLVPRSSIKIGLSRIRITRYENTFKFIVFSVLILGIIVPLILQILT